MDKLHIHTPLHAYDGLIYDQRQIRRNVGEEAVEEQSHLARRKLNSIPPGVSGETVKLQNPFLSGLNKKMAEFCSKTENVKRKFLDVDKG